MQCPLVAFWFPWYWDKSDVARVRRILSVETWRSEKLFWDRFKLGAKVLFWPLIAFTAIVFSIRIYGENPKKLIGKGRWGQFKDLLYLTYWRGLTPEWYYESALYLFPWGKEIGHYLMPPESKHAIRLIDPPSAAALVNSKVFFARHCSQNSIPAVPTLAEFEQGEMRGFLPQQNLPPNTLYFKPNDGYRGVGISRWHHRQGTRTWVSDQSEFPQEALLDYFKEASLTEAYVLQEIVQNDESIADLSPGGLITFRVMTVGGIGEEIEILGVYLGFPIDDTIANHRAYGGIAARMDPRTGRLDRGYSKEPKWESFREHPVTGAQIEGRFIAQFAELQQLAIDAHKTVPEVFAIGWDIVLTPTGPKVLEGNTQWASHLGMWLGQTSFVPRFLESWKHKNRQE